MDESIVTIVRSFIAFLTLLLFTRILGKQQVGQLSAFEYVTGITIGSIAASLSVDLSTKPMPHFIGLVTWTVLVFGFQYLTIKQRWLSKIVNDQPTIIIQNGKILEKNLRKMRYRYDDLLAHLREKDIFDITQVEYALLETNGELTVLKKAQYQTVTINDLKLTSTYTDLMTEVIQDGKIIKQNLKNKKLTETWLLQQLQAQGIQDLKEVSYAAILPNKQLYIDKFKDSLNDVEIGDFKGPY